MKFLILCSNNIPIAYIFYIFYFQQFFTHPLVCFAKNRQYLNWVITVVTYECKTNFWYLQKKSHFKDFPYYRIFENKTFYYLFYMNINFGVPKAFMFFFSTNETALNLVILTQKQYSLYSKIITGFLLRNALRDGRGSCCYCAFWDEENNFLFLSAKILYVFSNTLIFNKRHLKKNLKSGSQHF